MSLGGNAVFTFTAHPFVYFVKAPKLVGDYPFRRLSNKLFENLRHQADKYLGWPIMFLKTTWPAEEHRLCWGPTFVYLSLFF